MPNSNNKDSWSVVQQRARDTYDRNQFIRDLAKTDISRKKIIKIVKELYGIKLSRQRIHVIVHTGG